MNDLLCRHERKYIHYYMESVKSRPCESFWLFKDTKNVYIGYLENGKDKFFQPDHRKKDRRYNPPQTKVTWEV